MKVLVTGGAGYIGAVASETLLQAGHGVVVVDSLVHGHRAAVPPQAEFVQVDLLERAAVRDVLARCRPDAVMHFAGHIMVGESMEKPFKYVGENTVAGLHLLEAAVDAGVRRFILSSTANLFDKPERVPIDESSQIIPGSPYGESKLYLERTLAWLDRTLGVKFAALRYFNAAGATEERGEDHDPETHLIPLVLQVALGRRDRISIYGQDYDTPDGTCIRDYIHVSDLASAHVLALEALDRGSRFYNLGNGRGFSVLEVIEAARKITGHPIPVVMAPRRGGDVARLVADSTRIRRELGWTPRIPELDRIIESAWRWIGRHPRGYETPR
ncbi:MAG TPA: UDP-glucose 4-epimerase GalE [Planctomycetota bacterium]|nr:UDP-glucose 4-epimerase GalE [Planctomycetota bacterium]